MTVSARLEEQAFEPTAELAELTRCAGDDGAVVSFVGIARSTNKAGGRINELVLEHHPRLTARSLNEIASDAASSFGVSHIRVVHRCGSIAPGQPVVFAGAAALHRRAAFEAADYLMDRLKTEAVFWKREESEGGSHWIEPTETDYAERARWERSVSGIDRSLTFYPLRIAVLTVSDTRDEKTDKSGALIADRLKEAGHELAAKAIVKDDIEAIRSQVQALVGDPQVDVIISTGGTGFAPRDVTPEAVKPLFRREMDGFSVLFHMASFKTVGLSTLQSRAFAGQIEDTFIFCLPGSTGACRDGWDRVLAFELDSRHRPCSLAGQIPRLRDVCP